MTPKKYDPWKMRLNDFMENVRADTSSEIHFSHYSWKIFFMVFIMYICTQRALESHRSS